MTPTELTRPPLRADEAESLIAFLDYHRDYLRRKTEGLTQAQLAQPLAPSTMTLAGLLKHLALVEDNWFSEVLLGNPEEAIWAAVDWDADPDWEWRTAAEDSPEELRALFDGSVERADRCIRQALDEGGLDRLAHRESRRPGTGHFSLRWILLHMIEEYAQHNGHADLLREAVDGSTGE
ncbi:MAG: DinB family protein [Nocardioides sp.]